MPFEPLSLLDFRPRKRCRGCGEVKPLTAFDRARYRANGRAYRDGNKRYKTEVVASNIILAGASGGGIRGGGRRQDDDGPPEGGRGGGYDDEDYGGGGDDDIPF